MFGVIINIVLGVIFWIGLFMLIGGGIFAAIQVYKDNIAAGLMLMGLMMIAISFILFGLFLG